VIAVLLLELAAMASSDASQIAGAPESRLATILTASTY